MSKIINKFKFPNDNNEYQINAEQLGGKTLDELREELGSGSGDVVVAHVHPYTPSGVINEEVVEDITSTSKPIDDMVVLPAMTMTHSSTNSVLVFSWSAGSVSQDNVVTSVGAVNVTPTFTGTPSTTDVPTGTDASSIIEPYVVRKLDGSY